MLEIKKDQIERSADIGAAYDELYRKTGIRQRDSFYLWLLDLLEGKEDGTLLDISCGEGLLLRFAVERGFHTFGLDFSKRAVSIAQGNASEAFVCVANGEQIPFADASFDFITHIGSIEHYIHPDQGIQEIARLLKPKGRACILVPNAYGLFGNIKYVWQTGGIFDDGQPLQRYATRNTWVQLIERNGLIILKTFKYEREWPRTWRDLAWYLQRPIKLIRILLTPLIPLNLSNCFVFICSVAEGNGAH